MSLPEYDENEAITFMRRELPEEANKRYSDDDLVDILDAIWDYYDSVEATSLNDIPDDDDEDPRLQADAIAGGIFRILSKNGPEAINLPDLTLIVKGELAYEEDLGNRM
jgi:hypothetical protein